MEKVKSILFKLELKGKGVVNFDGKDHKLMWNLNKLGTYVNYDNVTFAKKHLYEDENGNKSYKLSISSNCLRNQIFECIQSPNVCHSENLLMAFIASPTGLLRGYLYPDFGIKRTSAFQIADAEQVNNSKSFIEFHSRSGEKLKKDVITDANNVENEEKDSDVTLFSKESIGDVVYETKGYINLSELQFISASDCYDRKAFNSDLFEKYGKVLKLSIPTFNSELNYYTYKPSDIKLPEYGLLLSNEDVNQLVKILLRKILGMSIKRSKAYAEVTSVKIKLVKNVLTDKFDSEDNWLELTPETIDSLKFDSEVFYELFDYNEAKAQDEEIKKSLDELSKAKGDKKKAKNEAKKEAKSKSAAKKTETNE